MDNTSGRKDKLMFKSMSDFWRKVIKTVIEIILDLLQKKSK
ncbi:MAG: hypothetical protein QME16_03695 [Planctomycetota bacterium]|nr:hypothetical protein [Planctomycetota bacterium]